MYVPTALLLLFSDLVKMLLYNWEEEICAQLQSRAAAYRVLAGLQACYQLSFC